MVYTYSSADQTITRTVDTRSPIVVLTGVTNYTVTGVRDGASVMFLIVRIKSAQSIQGLYERHIALPDKPGYV